MSDISDEDIETNDSLIYFFSLWKNIILLNREL
jgi:hypothetical protein